jgi:PBP1b-binding outer membrane lipoprotein LpoB
MKSYQILILIMLFIAGLASCGNDDDDNNVNSGVQRQAEKDLFSRWTRTDGLILDLSQGRLNTAFNSKTILQNGANCNCSLRITGTQSSGEIDFSSCFFGCRQLNYRGVPATFTKDENSLRICDPQCADYR